MKKKKKQGLGCEPKQENSNIYNKKINQQKSINTCNKQIKKYIECDDYEISCSDKCLDLAKKSNELFEKACIYESKASDVFGQSKNLENESKVLSAKAQNLISKSKDNKEKAKLNECKAQELLDKSKELFDQAKCLYKEGQQVKSQADEDLEQSKLLYKEAQNYSDKAKDLFNQASKCGEKAIQCYKTVGEKIKKYEDNSKFCKEMIDKCNNKLNIFEKNQINCEENPIYIKPISKCKPTYKNSYSNEIIYVEDTDICNNVSDMDNKLSQLCDLTYVDKYQEFNDMWMNYYNMVEDMTIKNMMNIKKNK